MTTVREELIGRIIQEQELVIGPLAWREAKKVSGLTISDSHAIEIKGNVKIVLAGLIAQYEGLFGPASLDVCREAVKSLLPQMAPEEIPENLK